MKKNGTHWNKLTRVDSRGAGAAGTNGVEDAAADDRAAYFPGNEAPDEDVLATPGVLTLAVVSVACAAAAIAAGSYALWLTRRRAAHNALTDVRDILQTCRERMGQLESDLSHLPQGFSSSSPAA